MALHRGQQLTATLNGAQVLPGQLDQNKTSKAEFRREQAVISVSDRLALRKLFGLLDLHCKSEEVAAKAPEFLASLKRLAQTAGGAPPLPPVPSLTDIDDLERRVGSNQVAAIRESAPEIEKRISQWKRARALAEQRLSTWQLTEALARHAAELPVAAEPLAQLRAIRERRLLLEPVDPVAPVRAKLADLLRAALKDAHAEYEADHAAALGTLGDNREWQLLAEIDRTAILDEAGLKVLPAPDVATDDALLKSLDGRSLHGWEMEQRAIPGSLALAQERAARRLEPKVRVVTIERTTLRSAEDVHRWADRQLRMLLAAIEGGPVLLS
jgi:hypothetical protein